MRPWIGLGLACASLLSACNSDSGPKKGEGPHPEAGMASCVSDPALANERDECRFGAGSIATDTVASCADATIPIEHVVVLMQENRSFDQYFGHLRGHGQDDIDVPTGNVSNPAGGGGTVPWHHETAYCVEDTDHGWAASHGQSNGGKNDGFALTNVTTNDPTGGRALGYYEESDLPFYYKLASTFAISDRYFCAVLGPTYPNRMYLTGGSSFGVVTTEITKLAPPGVATVYQELEDKGVTWKVYSTNLPSILLFPDTASKFQANRLANISQFASDAAAGTLPQVSFLDPGFEQAAFVETDEHPPADIQLGQHFVWEQLQALMHGPDWATSAFFLTYDEHGGLYDHVAPPPACVPDDVPPAEGADIAGFDQLGFRVPLTVISPYARRHFVSHTVHSHTSILRFIEAKFGLPAMTKRDANSDAMLDLFDFASAPNLDVPVFDEPPVSEAALAECKKAFPESATRD
jgi:phospholipase C